jgi:hypothetical protein
VRTGKNLWQEITIGRTGFIWRPCFLAVLWTIFCLYIFFGLSFRPVKRNV